MLDPSIEPLWQYYLEMERVYIRSKAMPALDRFITALLELPEEEWQAWADEITHRVVDEGFDIPVRMPLLTRVFCPVLISGILARKPGYARRMMHFYGQLVYYPEALDSLPKAFYSYDNLLKEAISVDPTDRKSRELFINWCYGYLDFTLHELPSGVLYGMNGATVEECEDLLQLLQLFEEQVELTGQRAKYDEIIAKCRFHYTAYLEYRLAGCPGKSYQVYLWESEKEG